MGYPSTIRWELSNGVTGTFVVLAPSSEFVEAVLFALQNGISMHIPEIVAMPQMFITEVTYTTTSEGFPTMEVWFREFDGQA